MARTGYTLPVFAVAAAKAALIRVIEKTDIASGKRDLPRAIALDLLPETAEIPIQQVAALDANSALAVTLSDPGDNLDLTRNTPIWAWVLCEERGELTSQQGDRALILEAGEGLGKTSAGEAAIYSYARRLFETNLLPLIPEDKTAIVRIILPEGRQLAQRTSNEAFGILEGLALLGTSGISAPLSAADHLEKFRQDLQTKVQTCTNLVFCLGNNGQQVARRLGIAETAVVQTGNWIGALLVEAGLCGAESVLLIGYQGKLIKLAGGIFNTSSHLADAKLEIIAAAVVRSGGNLEAVQAVLDAQTADGAYKELVKLGLAEAVFGYLAERIAIAARDYVQKYAGVSLEIGAILFDRQGAIVAKEKGVGCRV
ncbi:MAG: cobalt-precorrin-5B (C(1))-methyltransferase [Oscillatoria sp. SIO1A7]|nr:cobalt-precorrin-5B (C(1))-methyltransferase [Oscillatoria sp. SIO1A7]